jgi:hypothetical protein
VTFFVMGIKAVMHPEIVRRAHDEGHEIANHAWDHPVLTKISRDKVLDQLQRTSSAIEGIIRKKPVVMRPPYGNTNGRLNNFIFDHEKLSVVLWSFDTQGSAIAPQAVRHSHDYCIATCLIYLLCRLEEATIVRYCKECDQQHQARRGRPVPRHPPGHRGRDSSANRRFTGGGLQFRHRFRTDQGPGEPVPTKSKQQAEKTFEGHC